VPTLEGLQCICAPFADIQSTHLIIDSYQSGPFRVFVTCSKAYDTQFLLCDMLKSFLHLHNYGLVG
jgi:hypothetical protein